MLLRSPAPRSRIKALVAACTDGVPGMVMRVEGLHCTVPVPRNLAHHCGWPITPVWCNWRRGMRGHPATDWAQGPSIA